MQSLIKTNTYIPSIVVVDNGKDYVMLTQMFLDEQINITYKAEIPFDSLLPTTSVSFLLPQELIS